LASPAGTVFPERYKNARINTPLLIQLYQLSIDRDKKRKVCKGRMFFNINCRVIPGAGEKGTVKKKKKRLGNNN